MGMEKSGSTDPAAVMKALEGMEYDGLTSTARLSLYRPSGQKELLSIAGQGG